jgi:AcrR family transcriptional regulator
MRSTNTGGERRPPTAKPAVAERGARPKRKRDRAAKKQALIVAATKLFAHRGYEATTTREVATRAGCSEGLIHRYFKSKAGLLLTIIRSEVSQEVADLRERLPLASTVGDEIIQLVNWEVYRMWENREFLRVVIPRALLDPVLRQVSTIGPLQQAKAIGERLRKFKECRALPDEEIDALAHFISVLGFTFGFVRPVVLRQDPDVARKMAATIAGIMVRSFESATTSSKARRYSRKPPPLFT